MLKKGFLASDRFYACTEHNDKIIDSYLDSLNDIFKNTFSNVNKSSLKKIIMPINFFQTMNFQEKLQICLQKKKLLVGFRVGWNLGPEH